MIFVRHGRAVAQAGTPTHDWPLDPAHVNDIAGLRAALPAVPVVCSDMRRAVETAAFFGEPTVDPRLAEVSRPWTADIGAALARYFDDEALDGWEPQGEARTRIHAVVADHPGSILVTHGTVMSLYLASVVPSVSAMGFWTELRNPDAWHFDGTRLVRLAGTSS